ncbi:uncharacterized protein LOC111143745 [Enhydra lutris kenyoni]|uniref:Uncharacterized protein LOC111143745 n=1 Tax=Enhydra lutris kenyoni TaxID=391180 RepID=A0A2Y9J5Q2_ENHLU|nr:uncharacterized protein LOC111143745 [Enhydra lutris kenyoni]
MGMERGELGRKVACWPGMESHRPPGQGHRDAAAPARLRRDPGLGNLSGTPQASKERKPRKCVWWRGGDPTRRFPAAHPVPTPTRGAGHVCRGPVRGEAGFPGSSAREGACLAGVRECVSEFSVLRGRRWAVPVAGFGARRVWHWGCLDARGPGCGLPIITNQGHQGAHTLGERREKVCSESKLQAPEAPGARPLPPQTRPRPRAGPASLPAPRRPTPKVEPGGLGLLISLPAAIAQSAEPGVKGPRGRRFRLSPDAAAAPPFI